MELRAPPAPLTQERHHLVAVWILACNPARTLLAPAVSMAVPLGTPQVLQRTRFTAHSLPTAHMVLEAVPQRVGEVRTRAIEAESGLHGFIES